MIEELWSLAQQSRILQAFRQEIQGVWNDEAARELNARYLNQHQDDDDRMRRSLDGQQRALQDMDLQLANAAELAVEATKLAEQVRALLHVVDQDVRTAYAQHELAARSVNAAKTQFPVIEQLLGQANTAGGGAPDLSGVVRPSVATPSVAAPTVDVAATQPAAPIAPVVDAVASPLGVAMDTKFAHPLGMQVLQRAYLSGNEIFIRAFDATKTPELPKNPTWGDVGRLNLRLEKDPAGTVLRARLQDIETTEHYRRGGVGDQLLAQAEALAASHGAAEIYGSLDTEIVRDWYTKRGYSFRGPGNKELYKRFDGGE